MFLSIRIIACNICIPISNGFNDFVRISSVLSMHIVYLCTQNILTDPIRTLFYLNVKMYFTHISDFIPFFYFHDIFIAYFGISYNTTQSISFPRLSRSTLHSCGIPKRNEEGKNKTKQKTMTTTTKNPEMSIPMGNMGNLVIAMCSWRVKATQHLQRRVWPQPSPRPTGLSLVTFHPLVQKGLASIRVCPRETKEARFVLLITLIVTLGAPTKKKKKGKTQISPFRLQHVSIRAG